ncbi:MAG: hypothetical protein HC846_09250 [Blastocatellia bacterium]|nr:hypothetical protein [Blastocatellia bacterium]
MSPLIKIILIFVAALLFGLILFIVPVIAYYWGPNGKPTDAEERKKMREEELSLRAEQIERSKKNPILTRKSSFWDNRKVYKRE